MGLGLEGFLYGIDGKEGGWVLNSVAFSLHGLFHEMEDRSTVAGSAT
jgi:hypothetical protein